MFWKKWLGICESKPDDCGKFEDGECDLIKQLRESQNRERRFRNMLSEIEIPEEDPEKQKAYVRFCSDYRSYNPAWKGLNRFLLNHFAYDDLMQVIDFLEELKDIKRKMVDLEETIEREKMIQETLKQKLDIL